MMETDTESTSTTDTPAFSMVNLFMNHVNKQDVNGLLVVQNALFVLFSIYFD